MFKNGMRPVHPGEILLEDYIKPLGISVRALSLALHVPYSRLREVVDGNRGVSADTALRLERYFGSEAQGSPLAHLRRLRLIPHGMRVRRGPCRPKLLQRSHQQPQHKGPQETRPPSTRLL